MRSRIDLRCSIPAGLHRLDARPGLPPDVPDPLLRRLAQPERAPEQVLHVLATRRNLPGSTIFVPGRYFVRLGDREAVEEESAADANCPHHHPPRRGDLCLWPALSPAGIFDRLGMGAAQRPATR